jgi:hypothetical protein
MTIKNSPNRHSISGDSKLGFQAVTEIKIITNTKVSMHYSYTIYALSMPLIRD